MKKKKKKKSSRHLARKPKKSTRVVIGVLTVIYLLLLVPWGLFTIVVLTTDQDLSLSPNWPFYFFALLYPISIIHSKSTASRQRGIRAKSSRVLPLMFAPLVILVIFMSLFMSYFMENIFF